MFGPHRFNDVFVKSSFGSSLPPLIVPMCADDDSDRGRAAPSRSFQQMKTRSIRQLNVAKQQIEILVLAKLLRLLHGMGHLHLMSIPAEDSGKDDSRVGVIFNQKNFLGARTHGFQCSPDAAYHVLPLGGHCRGICKRLARKRFRKCAKNALKGALSGFDCKVSKLKV